MRTRRALSAGVVMVGLAHPATSPSLVRSVLLASAPIGVSVQRIDSVHAASFHTFINVSVLMVPRVYRWMPALNRVLVYAQMISLDHAVNTGMLV
jgi:hypothetical protein